ncbi:hypothetical protein [Nocardia sp. NPDC046763]|uniref:hypothetical protein n=1 Tax=Nocardia sp. NPDC046763 TaxID=3155256 RepID=UPI0034094349
MSIIVKFFMALSHESAAAVVDYGPGRAFESLVYGNLDAAEALVEWESILTGRSFEELVAAGEPEAIASRGGKSPLIFVASKALQDALAAADMSRLVEAGQLWVQERAADGEAIDREIATEILSELARLARSEGGRDHRVYCWMA